MQGQHSLLVVTAGGKALDSLCDYWQHSPSYCRVCVYMSAAGISGQMTQSVPVLQTNPLQTEH